LNCEVCGVALPDFIYANGEKINLIPIHRPATSYLLLERVYFDKSKENTTVNPKMLILLGIDTPES